VASLSATADSAATIPYAIDAAVHGDYTPLAQAYVEDVGPDLDARARLASFWVILCSEPWASFDPGATARAGAGSYLTAAAVVRARVFRRACRVVPKGRTAAGTDAADPSTPPVLLLSGGADPLDPPASVGGWRRAYPDGRLVVVPGAGHGEIGFECVQEIVARFVASGSTKGLHTSCARRVLLPPFEVG
jgi:pimeloyl-ACP methyl ester carboxylesterase